MNFFLNNLRIFLTDQEMVEKIDRLIILAGKCDAHASPCKIFYIVLAAKMFEPLFGIYIRVKETDCIIEDEAKSFAF